LPKLVDQIDAGLQRQGRASGAIKGRSLQRWKATLRSWLEQMLACDDDIPQAERCWQVGRRHEEIGLDPVYTNVAMSCLRQGLIGELARLWRGTRADLLATVEALNLLLDFDLAVIQEAYQTEHDLRLERSQRLVTIGQIAGGISHELRNPLNAVKTSVYYLLNARKLTPEKLGEHLGRINRQADKADAVIAVLSDFASMPDPTIKRFDVQQAISGAIGADPLPGHTQIHTEVNNGTTALGDIDQIQIVLGNLIRNALDAMPTGGVLTISAQSSGGMVKIVVADSGAGIAQHDLEHILEPLYTTKARGIGLGLSIAHAIVDKHHGKLSIESVHGQGSEFTIELTSGDEPVAGSDCCAGGRSAELQGFGGQ
jgi:signal transduction histidine kinase